MVLNVHLDESTGALRWLKPYTERLEGKNNAGMRAHLLPHSAHESETDKIPPLQAHALTTVRITLRARARARLQRLSWRQALALADPRSRPCVAAGEFALATKDGGAVILIDSQSYGSPETGGNFALAKLAPFN